jgi:putative tryptophan/tyrosine transport system substrate-binding protein
MAIKTVIVLLVGLTLASVRLAEAQQAGKVAKIGLLGGSSASAYSARLETFRQRLRELGYVEGKNIVIEYRYGEAKFDRLPALADELVGLKVDVLILPRHPLRLLPRMLPRVSPSFF